ncbi:MAG: hypothetical protein V2A65_05170 [Candidatus Omnitrophota bacterium]
MEKKLSKLKKLHDYFSVTSIPNNFSEIIKEELEINLEGKYGPYFLKNPILIAPGQLTVNTNQISRIKDAGYAGCILKSVVGEDKKGNCSMGCQRRKATYTQTVYDTDDRKGSFPIIHWDGRGDTRTLSEYLLFAREAIKYSDVGVGFIRPAGLINQAPTSIDVNLFNAFVLVASTLCHLPSPREEIKEEEWLFTAKNLFSLGYNLLEIDFCPSLKKEDGLIVEKENILRWYKTVPSLIKSASPRIMVYPKLLNLDWGLDFQIRMVAAAQEGKSDGIIVANRIFKEEYNSAHGGKELRERNLRMVKEIKKTFPDIPISATGGIYSGRHVFDYLNAGAENVQLLSYIMGKVNTPFARKTGNKLEKVFHNLMLDPEDGLISCMLQLCHPERRRRVSSFG